MGLGLPQVRCAPFAGGHPQGLTHGHPARPAGQRTLEAVAMKTRDLATLKKHTDLVTVVQSRGVALSRKGNDYVGLCPFHQEKTASFHVTPAKNLFHCFGCDAAGSVIDFVMRKDGLTF